MNSVKRHRAAIVVMNILIALLCIASIAGYFVAPLLSIRIKVDLSAEDLESMAGSASVEGVEVVYPDPEPIDVELSFETTDFISPFLEDDPIEGSKLLIEKKIDSLSAHISSKMRVLAKDVAEGTIRNTVTQIVIDKTHEAIKEALPDAADEEIGSIMEEAQITDEYLSEKTNAVIDAIYKEDSTVDKVGDVAVETVDEVFQKLQSTGREEFSDQSMTDETEQQIRDIVSENVGSFANEDGKLNADDIVDIILEEIASAMGGSVEQGSPVASLSASDARAAEEDTASEAEQKLAANIANYIRETLDAESNAQIFFYISIGALVLTAISMLAWLYLLIKIFVKGFTMNPAVKLKAPILFLGWLPALVFFIIPTAAFMAVNALGGIGALAGESLTMIGGVSFFTSGLIALAAAVLLIILFIPYGIIRKKLKLELASRITPQEEAAYISANPALVPQEPIVMEHTVSDETAAADDDLYENSDENAPDGTDND